MLMSRRRLRQYTENAPVRCVGHPAGAIIHDARPNSMIRGNLLIHSVAVNAHNQIRYALG